MEQTIWCFFILQNLLIPFDLFVVRGFVTGSTDTSLWTVYNKGVRNYCGNALPEGMVKNQKLPRNILTPTTKAVDHDVPVTPNEVRVSLSF